jgi:effector-binding domain-containing protein
MDVTIAAPARRPEVVQLEPRQAAVTRVAGKRSEIASLLHDAFELTMEQVARSGGQVAGPPFARYLGFGERIEAEVGFPCVGELSPTERVHEATLPGGRAVMLTYVGSYDEIGEAWNGIGQWMAKHGFVPASAPWESYLTGPDDPGLPVTQIVFPIH